MYVRAWDFLVDHVFMEISSARNVSTVLSAYTYGN